MYRTMYTIKSKHTRTIMNSKGSRDQPSQQKVRKQELRIKILYTRLIPNLTRCQSRD